MHTLPPKTLAQDGGEGQNGAECAVCNVKFRLTRSDKKSGAETPLSFIVGGGGGS